MTSVLTLAGNRGPALKHVMVMLNHSQFSADPIRVPAPGGMAFVVSADQQRTIELHV
jgi:hypothetical protein